MFSKDKEPIQVALDLDISYIEVTQYYKEYLSLKHMDDFVRTCKDYPDLDKRSYIISLASSSGVKHYLSLQYHLTMLIFIANNRLRLDFI